MKIKTPKDLCETCARTIQCPIYPTLRITTHCVEYKERGTSPSSKK